MKDMIAVDTLEGPRKHLYEAMCWAVKVKELRGEWAWVNEVPDVNNSNGMGRRG